MTEINNVMNDNKEEVMYPYVANEISIDFDLRFCYKSFKKLYLMDEITLENNKKNQWIMTKLGEAVKLTNATYYQNDIYIYMVTA